MKNAIAFNSELYRPITLSNILYQSIESIIDLSELLVFDNPINFRDNVSFIIFKLENTRFFDRFISMLLDSIYYIFFYTYEHLSFRTYDGKVISELSLVEDMFLELYLGVDQLSFHQNKIYQVKTCISLLKMLMQLGGARSILKNNALQLMISLAFFIKYVEAA